MSDGQPTEAQLQEMEQELTRRAELARSQGLNPNRQALLRRLAQERGKHYDSAEWVIRGGAGAATGSLPAAGASAPVRSVMPKPAGPQPSGPSRFAAAEAPAPEPEEDAEEEYEYEYD